MRITFFALTALVLVPGCPSSSGTDAGTDAPSGTDTPRTDGGGVDGGTGTDAGGSDGGGTDGGGGSDAPSTALGDCNVDADCPPGGTCVELTPGGYRVCRVPPVQATGCDASRPDECCTTADCTTGQCFLGPVRESCAGPVRSPYNVCAVDECAVDADCTDGGICAPAGTFGPVALCVAGACHGDDDCTAEAGGQCVVFTDPCCGVRVGLFCSYPSDGCQTNADCTGGYCDVRDGRASCMSGGPTCPL